MAEQRTEAHTPLRKLSIPGDEWKALGAYGGDRQGTGVVREFIRRPGATQPELPRVKETVTASEEPSA